MSMKITLSGIDVRLMRHTIVNISRGHPVVFKYNIKMK